jgi:D-alanyl-lipoteichoic acid acyltransferase DltB (MBOAT superfamily)
MAVDVTPVYELAGGGGGVSLFPGWIAALGFTLQIYFDFSGYCDMAAGLARCLGIRLPLNFYSPLQATSIIDFWSRWHVTLTRFLTAYLYNPLALWLTRRRLANGLPGLGGRNASLGAFLQLLAVPMLVTMFVSGVWHGAGYVFVLWGLLHGVYLTINHAWRLAGPKLWPNKVSYGRVMRPVGFVLTFLSVVMAMVLFRSPSVHAAVSVFKGMLGLNGIELPRLFIEKLAGLGLPLHLVSAVDMPAKAFVVMQLWIFALLAIALALPNGLQMMARYEPVLGVNERPANTGLLPFALTWKPTLLWAFALSALAAVAIIQVGGPSEFLYWQF